MGSTAGGSATECLPPHPMIQLAKAERRLERPAAPTDPAGRRGDPPHRASSRFAQVAGRSDVPVACREGPGHRWSRPDRPLRVLGFGATALGWIGAVENLISVCCPTAPRAQPVPRSRRTVTSGPRIRVLAPRSDNGQRSDHAGPRTICTQQTLPLPTGKPYDRRQSSDRGSLGKALPQAIGGIHAR